MDKKETNSQNEGQESDPEGKERLRFLQQLDKDKKEIIAAIKKIEKEEQKDQEQEKHKSDFKWYLIFSPTRVLSNIPEGWWRFIVAVMGMFYTWNLCEMVLWLV